MKIAPQLRHRQSTEPHVGTGFTAPPHAGHVATPAGFTSVISLLLAGARCLARRAAIGAAPGTRALIPAPGRARDGSGRHPESRQHHPLQRRPGGHGRKYNQELAAAHYASTRIAARPRVISSFSAFT